MSSRNGIRIEHGPSNAVYLDHAATTPADSQVIAAMNRCLGIDGVFGNAASRPHRFGQEARDAVEKAREQTAALIHADPSEIVWTSGATESINLAIKGAAHGCAGRGRHIVTSGLEHKAVLDSYTQLAREGFEITHVRPGADGLIAPESVREALRDDTILVSLMHVNNETGAVTDIAAVGEITRSRGIAFHVDAAQSAARLPLDMRSMQADLVSLSAHKMYGPKGAGALYARRRPRVRLEALIHGGGHEQGLRSGTLATHQLVGMGEAARLARERRARDAAAAAALDRRLLDSLLRIEHARLNGSATRRAPGIANVAFACVKSESLMMVLQDVAVSSGSACTSSRIEPSHVLQALGVPGDLAACSIRFSLGRFTTEREVDFAARRVRESVEALRELSPQWQALRRRGRGVEPAALRQEQAVTA